MHTTYVVYAMTLSSVGSVQNLSPLFNPPARPLFCLRIDYSYCDRIHSSLTTVHCVDSDQMGKRLVAWKEYVQGTGCKNS